MREFLQTFCMEGGTNFPKRHDFTHPNDHIPHTYEMTVIICHFMGSGLLRLEMGLTKGLKIVRVPGGGTPHMKGVGMLIVSLRGINFGFWSHLGCSGQNAIIFSREGLV